MSNSSYTHGHININLKTLEKIIIFTGILILKSLQKLWFSYIIHFLLKKSSKTYWLVQYIGFTFILISKNIKSYIYINT